MSSITSNVHMKDSLVVRDSYGSPVFHGFMQDSTEILLQTRHIMHVNQLNLEFELEEDGHIIPPPPSPASDHLPIPDVETDEHVETDEVPDFILHIQGSLWVLKSFRQN